jgi:hypothetical protein
MIAAVLDFIANIFALILLLGVFLVVWTTPFGQPITFEFYRRNGAFGIIIIHQDRAQALQLPAPEPETEEDPWQVGQQKKVGKTRTTPTKRTFPHTMVGINQLQEKAGKVKEESP